MKTFAPRDLGLSRRLHIADWPSESLARIGGAAPASTESLRLRPEGSFVLSIPLATSPDLYASVFVNATFDRLVEAMNEGLQTDDRIVAVVHEPSGPSDLGRFSSVLSSHPLVFGAPQPDLETLDDGRRVPDSAHKVGGRPYCIQEPELPGAERLQENGYLQVLQIDFPGSEDADIEGDWPFGDGIFNLFWKPPFQEGDSFWYLQG